MSALGRYLDPRAIQRIERLDLRARFIVDGFLAGRHAARVRGHALEFAEHRHYTPGDDPRSVDWRVFARTDRLFIRQHHAETHLHCTILIDASASMGRVGFEDANAPVIGTGAAAEPGAAAEREPPHAGAMTKLDYAAHLAAALAYLLHRQRDAVGLGVLREGLDAWAPPRARANALAPLLATLEGLYARGGTGLSRGAAAALARVPHRGLFVLISDLLADGDGALEACRCIRGRGHDLIVLHVLDAAEAAFALRGALRLVDPESGAVLEVDAASVRERYLAAMSEWRGRLRLRLAGLRADYAPIDTSQPFDAALSAFLTRRAKRK